jgi:hypothetical protein
VRLEASDRDFTATIPVDLAAGETRTLRLTADDGRAKPITLKLE